MVLDLVRMIELGDHVRMLVVERRRRRARNELQAARAFDPHRPRIGHVNAPLRLGLDFQQVWVGERSLKGGFPGS
jgi:hypothetical protein